MVSTPRCGRGNPGSNPGYCSSIHGLVGYDDRLTRGRSPVRFRVDVCITVPVAQWIRHLTTNQGIVGSNPTGDVFAKDLA